MSDNNESKKLIIITGPQGSGNHLFSKLFDYHPDVKGWDFGDKYWIPSDEEPFADCWIDPLKTKDMLTHPLMVANVSVPFVYDGVREVPKIQEVVNEAKDAGYDVKVCIVVIRQSAHMSKRDKGKQQHVSCLFPAPIDARDVGRRCKTRGFFHRDLGSQTGSRLQSQRWHRRLFWTVQMRGSRIAKSEPVAPRSRS